MPRFGYSAKIEGPHAKAYGRELRISPKDAVEICRVIRGMKLVKAKEFLRRVQRREVPVPYRTHKKKLAHKRGVSGAGAFPVKAARELLRVLQNVEENAKYKGMEVEKLQIVHASAYKGITIPGIMPRAFGRATPANKPLTNVEIIVKEVS
jgi:large subunit ribosomal protein L22